MAQVHHRGQDQEAATATVMSTNTSEAHEKQASTIVDPSSASDSTRCPTPPSDFPDLYFTYTWGYIALYALFLFLCNFVLPCILYYPLVTLTTLSTKTVVGISSAALGISSCFDSPVRLWRLAKYRGIYGPLGTDVWWHLDFSMWVYTIALFFFAVPLAIAPALRLYNFFLMSTVLLVGPLAFVFFISLFRPRMPVRCSSDPPGEKMKPAVFYVVEDVASVDFMHGKEFRRTLHRRWDVSPPFRSLIMQLTIFWTISGAVYCGVTAAVTWAAPFRFAFGYILGQLFVWAAVSWLICHHLAVKGLKREREWLAKTQSNGQEKAGNV